MTSVVALATISLATVLAPTEDDIVQKSFKDATFVTKIVTGKQAELKKINDDFAFSYRFSTVKAQLKEPLMLRLESTVDDTNLLYIMNGARKKYSIPKIGINKVEDVSKAPGKWQTVMEFGILTPALFKSLFDGKYVRTERDGDLVFDLTYIKSKFDDTSRHRVWVHPDRRYITKRVWYSQEGRLMATFDYTNPTQQGGVWFPTKCTVTNVEGKVAGVTQYTNIKVNAGVSDSLFKF